MPGYVVLLFNTVTGDVLEVVGFFDAENKAKEAIRKANSMNRVYAEMFECFYFKEKEDVRKKPSSSRRKRKT